ncbi:5-formyltetrahydrofolate cyclo-ligase [Alkalibacter rhizosphaerae]|uniref:5-formyltetrahydrofolate cyclo-ligase n=1 Tax=Alkalibacter rhizosphaerae TaxID=2815577 RepID=A0A974XEE1_9FIRM|nr:5-formyltetrahydrofolate cyclo-ligase [Alkalibacter rhizosphaerae]QSX08312.1 5-formyltetrahydrofolate cyclo-ligase [Alkalibacter rhizosphaerae]
MDKKETRKQVLDQRKTFTKEYVEENGRQIFQKIKEMDVYKRSSIVMAYVSFENEVDTFPMIQEMIQEGKTVITPICNFKDRTMKLAVTRNFPEGFMETKYGILELPMDHPEAVEPEEVDLIITPGVAFTRDGKRLGYGAGFYDRLLSKKRPDCPTVCPAFTEFVLEDLPTDQYDLPVDYVVTKDELIDTRKERGRMEHA